MSEEKKETVADIVAKSDHQPDENWKSICAKCADGEIEPDCEYYGEPNGCNSPTYGHHPKTISRSDTVFGNAAAMREALEEFIAYSEVVFSAGMFNREHLERLVQKAKAAIAAPPRNCDMFKTSDAAITAFVSTLDDDAKPHWIVMGHWLFETAETKRHEE